MVRNNIKKVFFFLDSRATYSYSKNIIIQFKKKRKLKYETIISGAYLDKNFGNSLKMLKKDGIKIGKKISFKSSNNQIHSWAHNLGQAIKHYSVYLGKVKPDLMVITGDRIETLAMCLTCSYMNIPIAHVQAGDKSGHIDDLARGAIAKFSNIHFTSCIDSKNRLLSMGEEKKRIFNVGAPQLDDIHLYIKKNNLKIKKTLKNILIMFHPVLNEREKVKEQIDNIISAVLSFDANIKIIYPNNDLGFKNIIKRIKKIKLKKVKVFKNLDRDKFIKLLNDTSILIGNSSCGIIEAPSFKLRVLNIGSRQNLRPQAQNIRNCNYNRKQIIDSINFAFNDKKYLKNLKKTKNLYFKKNSGLMVFQHIKKILLYKNEILKKY